MLINNEGERMRDEEQARAKEAAMYAAQANALKSPVRPMNECASEQSCGPSRQSARGVLEMRYETLLREANGIHALLQALHGSMGREAEEALWKIVIDQRR